MFVIRKANAQLSTRTMKEIAQQQERTCASWIDGYEQWTPEGVTRHRHTDCVHVQLPTTMGVPPRTNEQYRRYFSKLLLKTIRNFKTKWHVLANDAVNNTAVLHITATSESVIGPYENEYIFILWFTKDGKEITRIEEMVDSKTTSDFFAKLRLSLEARLPAKLSTKL